MKIYREAGCRWEIPDVIHLHRHDGPYGYRVEYRCPKLGEYFLSGAVVTAYEAFSNMSTRYLVVVEWWPVRKVEYWERIPARP